MSERLDPDRTIFLSTHANAVEALAGTAYPECDDAAGGGVTGRVLLSLDVRGRPLVLGVAMTPELARHFARCIFHAAADSEQAVEWDQARLGEPER